MKCYMWWSYSLLHIIWLYVRYVRTEDGPMNMYDSIGGAIYYINQLSACYMAILRFMT